MTDDAKRLVEVLRHNAEWCKKRERDPYLLMGGCMALAADLIEKLSADLESDERQYGRDAFATLADEGAKLEAERNEWKRRAEAMECDLHSSINHLDNCCELCAHNRPCGEGICPQYISGVGVADRPDWKWSCMQLEFGTCQALENTPCQGCVLGNHWRWRGPCAENGGAMSETD